MSVEGFDWSKVKVRKVGGVPSQPKVWSREAKLVGTWAQIPHDRGLKLAKRVRDPVLAVLLALEHAIHTTHSNQVDLTNNLLGRYGITRQSKNRGLRQLAAAGVITVEWREKSAPAVTHHWYTKGGRLK